MYSTSFCRSPCGHLNVVQYLAEQGADKEARDHNRCTPLHFASRCGHLNVVQYLVEQGGDKNECDGRIGYTPLHCAAHNGSSYVVQYLVQQGANTEALAHNHKTPLQTATFYRNTKVRQAARRVCISYLEQHRRFRRLIAHDTREYLNQLGLYSVERDAIISFFTVEIETNETGADADAYAINVDAVRTEFDAFNAAQRQWMIRRVMVIVILWFNNLWNHI